ncbi:MAG: hypothetical protein HY965_07765 [Ignavibacteriales bacterium]|nr:hypothetical protein [Ignavibacteriales bacterium]
MKKHRNTGMSGGLVKMKNERLFKHSVYYKTTEPKNQWKSFWAPTISDWRDIIEDYISIAKRRKTNKLAMIKLQQSILEDIVLTEKALKTYKNWIANPANVAEITKDRPIEDEDIDYWKSELTNYTLIKKALMDIGDGIAWRIYNYDRSVIYHMCVNNNPSGPIEFDRGKIKEIEAVDDLARDDETTDIIYHAITNFLLIGDLTITDRNGNTEIIEVKSNKKMHGKSCIERMEKQVKRQENIIMLANDGFGNSNNIEISVRTLAGKPITKLKQIKNLLRKVEKRVCVDEYINEYLRYIVLNIESKNAESNIDILQKIKNNKNNATDDEIIFYDSIKDSVFSPNLAPLSIHKFCCEDIANLLLGKYILIIEFNFTKFRREFQKKGFEIEKTIKPTKNLSPFSIKKNELRIDISPYFFCRLLYEGFAIENLIEIFNNMYSQKQTEKALFFEYKEEKSLWD